MTCFYPKFYNITRMQKIITKVIYSETSANFYKATNKNMYFSYEKFFKKIVSVGRFNIFKRSWKGYIIFLKIMFKRKMPKFYNFLKTLYHKIRKA